MALYDHEVGTPSKNILLGAPTSLFWEISQNVVLRNLQINFQDITQDIDRDVNQHVVV